MYNNRNLRKQVKRKFVSFAKHEIIRINYHMETNSFLNILLHPYSDVIEGGSKLTIKIELNKPIKKKKY